MPASSTAHSASSEALRRARIVERCEADRCVSRERLMPIRLQPPMKRFATGEADDPGSVRHRRRQRVWGDGRDLACTTARSQRSRQDISVFRAFFGAGGARRARISVATGFLATCDANRARGTLSLSEPHLWRLLRDATRSRRSGGTGPAQGPRLVPPVRRCKGQRHFYTGTVNPLRSA